MHVDQITRRRAVEGGQATREIPGLAGVHVQEQVRPAREIRDDPAHIARGSVTRTGCPWCTDERGCPATFQGTLQIGGSAPGMITVADKNVHGERLWPTRA